MTDIALDFSKEAASVRDLSASLIALKAAAKEANTSSLESLRKSIAALGLSSKEQLQQIASDTRSILQRLQQEVKGFEVNQFFNPTSVKFNLDQVKQSVLSSAKDTTVGLAVEAVRQAEIQATANKAAIAAAKTTAAEIKKTQDGAQYSPYNAATIASKFNQKPLVGPPKALWEAAVAEQKMWAKEAKAEIAGAYSAYDARTIASKFNQKPLVGPPKALWEAAVAEQKASAKAAAEALKPEVLGAYSAYDARTVASKFNQMPLVGPPKALWEAAVAEQKLWAKEAKAEIVGAYSAYDARTIASKFNQMPLVGPPKALWEAAVAEQKVSAKAAAEALKPEVLGAYSAYDARTIASKFNQKPLVGPPKALWEAAVAEQKTLAKAAIEAAKARIATLLANQKDLDATTAMILADDKKTAAERDADLLDHARNLDAAASMLIAEEKRVTAERIATLLANQKDLDATAAMVIMEEKQRAAALEASKKLATKQTVVNFSNDAAIARELNRESDLYRAYGVKLAAAVEESNRLVKSTKLEGLFSLHHAVETALATGADAELAIRAQYGSAVVDAIQKNSSREIRAIIQAREAAAVAAKSGATSIATLAVSSKGSLIETGTRGIDHSKAKEDTDKLGNATKALTSHTRLLNDGFRGLVQSLGMYSASMTAIIPMMAGMAAGMAAIKPLKVGAEFEQSMFVIHELAGTTTADMVKVKEAVLEVGASTQYGPLEVAKGLEILTLAGLSTVDALQAIKPVLHFASTGGVTLEAAAETLVAVGTAYKYSAQNFEVVGDVIAKTAADTMASVTDMSAAFKQSTVVAQQYGMSLQDTAQAFGMLAQVGIRGTAAGTAYRNMLMEFNKGSGKAADGIKLLGVELKNADGSAKDLMTTMESLSKGLITKNSVSQARLLDDIGNERGGKGIASFQAAFNAELNKTNPLLQREVDLLVQSGKASEAKKVAEDAVTAAYAKMRDAAAKSAESTGAYSFLVNLEEQFTTLGTYKGLLASLQTDFVKAFDTASDSTKLLALSLRETLNTPEFTNAIAAITNAALGAAEALARLAAFTLDSPVAAVAGLTAAFLTAQVAIAALPMLLAAAAAGVTAVGQSLAMMAALVAGAFEISAGAAILAVGGVAVAIAAAVTGIGYFIYSVMDSKTEVEKAEAAKREEFIKTATTQTELQEKTLNAQQGQLDAEVARVGVLNEVWIKNRKLTELANAYEWQSITVTGGKTSEAGKALHEAAETLRAQRMTNTEAEAKAAGEAMQARITQWEETKLQIIDATRLQKEYNLEASGGMMSGGYIDNLAKIHGEAADSAKAVTMAATAARARAKAAAEELAARRQLQGYQAQLDASEAKNRTSGTGVGGYTGNSGKPKFTRSPHVEQVKLETTNILEEMAKRDKLVLDANKNAAANNKAVLDAELAANLITKSRYAAEVRYLEEQTAAKTIADIEKQQTAREEAAKKADIKVLEAQAKFNKLNVANPKAIVANNESIDKVRADNANKLKTEELTTAAEIKKIRDKADTDAEVAATKHIGELKKIDKDFSDWQVSELALKEKNLRAIRNAEALRNTTPIQAARLTAENTEFERLTANAEKYDAQINELTDSKIKYAESLNIITVRSEKDEAIAKIETETNKLVLEQLDKLIARKAKLTGGIPVAVQIKGEAGADEFIRSEVARIRDGLTEAIINSGKDGGKALREILEAELLTKPFKMVIQALIQPISDGIAQGIVGQTLGGGSSTLNSLGNMVGLGNTFANLGSTMHMFGTQVLASGQSMLGMTGTFAQLSASTTQAAGSVAGLNGAMTLAAKAVPYVAAAAAVGKVVEKLTTSNTYSEGVFAYGRNSPEGFKTGGRAAFAQEGWNGSSKNSTWFDLGEETNQYMSSMGNLVTKSVKEWAAAIGLSAEAVDNYTAIVETSTIEGLNTADKFQVINKAMAGYGDAMVQALFGEVMAFANGDEAPTAVLERMGNDVTAVNSILAGFGKPLFDASFESAKAVQVLIDSVGGLDKLKGLATDLVTVNDNLAKLGLPLFDVSVASAQAAQGMLTATNAAVEALDAANKLEASYASFAKNLSKDPDTTQVTSLKATFEKAMAAVTDYIPTLKGKSLSSITYDDYAGFNEPQRAKLDAAAIAFKDLQTAIDSAAKTAESAAKTAKDAADTAAKAYSDALQSVQDDTQAVLAQTSDIGKTEFQKQIAQIQRDGVKKQVELDKLSTASNKAAEEYADLTKAAADAAKTVNTLSDTFSTVSSGARTLGTTASKMIADIATSLAKAGVKTPEQNQAQALAMTVVQPGKGFATGGRITGPGTSTSDSIPAMLKDSGGTVMLSDKEWIIQAASAEYYGDGFMDAVNKRKLPKTIFRASGGPVSGAVSSGFDPYSQKSIIDTWVNALNWGTESMLSSALTLKNVAEDNGITVAQLKEFGYSLDSFSTETKALIQANVSPKTWDWANGAASVSGGQPYTPTSSAGATSVTGGASAVTENTVAKLTGAYETQRVSMLGLYKATETQTDANNALAAAGYDVSGLSADGIKKYFAGLLDAAKPIYNEDGTIKEFSADAIKAINQIDKLGGSIGTLTKVAEDRQNWQDKLDVLTGKTTEQALSRQKELAGTTDTATISIIKQVHAQEDLAKATAALKTYTDAYASLNVELVSAMGDKSQAYAVQKAIDLADVYRDQTPATAALISKQYDLNAARKEEIELLNSAKTRLENYTNAGASKGVELLRLQGDTAGADKAQEAIDLGDVFKSTADAIALLATEGLTPLDKAAIQATIQTNDLTIAQYARNKALDNEIETLRRYKAMSESATSALDNTANSVTNSRIGLLNAQGNTAGAAALQRELDIEPYTKAIKEAQTELTKATTATEKSTLADVVSKNTQAIANYDLSKSLDKEAESARAAQEAANALAQAYAGLNDQIAQANIELMKASGNAQGAEEAAMALALREHEGDAYYASLYRELLTIQKLTEARNQLNGLEETAVQKQIALKRASGSFGDKVLANGLEREAALKSLTAPAVSAKAELDRSNMNFGQFVSAKGLSTNLYDLLISQGADPKSLTDQSVMAGAYYNPAKDPTTLAALSSNASGHDTNLDAISSTGILPGALVKLFAEYRGAVRTTEQKSTLQSVVDTASGIAAAYDLNKSLEGQLKIIELQDEAYKANLDAQKNLADAQKSYADVLKSTISTMRDFLQTLDGAASPLQNLSTSRTNFQAIAGRAASGDTSAYKDLTPAAKTFLDLSKNYSKTIQDYQRDEAKVRATLNAVINVNQRELDKLPQEIAAVADPTKDAWLKLQEATAKEAETGIMLTALGVDSAASKQRLRTAEETLGERYIEQVYLLEETKKTSLLDAFTTAVNTKVSGVTLPTFDMTFNLGDIWGTKIAGVLPQRPMTNAELEALISGKFPGLRPSDFHVPLTPSQLAELLNGKFPTLTAANLVGVPANMVELVNAELAKVFTPNFAGPAFNAQQMMQDAINRMLAAVAKPNIAPDTVTTAVNKVLEQELTGGTTGTGTSFSALSATQAAALFGADTATVTDAAKFTAMVDKYETNPGLVSFMTSAGVDMTKWLSDANAYGKYKGFPGFTGASFSALSATQAAALFGADTATVTDAAKFTAMVDKYETNPGLVSFMTSAGVDMTKWLSDANAYGKAKGFPGFAVGTNYVPQDMLAQIHEGEAIIPAPFNPERYSKASGNDALVAEIKALREEVARLREEQRAGQNAIAANTGKTARVLTKFDIDGLPETRT